MKNEGQHASITVEGKDHKVRCPAAVRDTLALAAGSAGIRELTIELQSNQTAPQKADRPWPLVKVTKRPGRNNSGLVATFAAEGAADLVYTFAVPAELLDVTKSHFEAVVSAPDWYEPPAKKRRKRAGDTKKRMPTKPLPDGAINAALAALEAVNPAAEEVDFVARLLVFTHACNVAKTNAKTAAADVSKQIEALQLQLDKHQKTIAQADNLLEPIPTDRIEDVQRFLAEILK